MKKRITKLSEILTEETETADATDLVGKEFAEDYFDALVKVPHEENVGKFYYEFSRHRHLRRQDVGDVRKGRTAIVNLIKRLKFAGAKIEIRVVDTMKDGSDTYKVWVCNFFPDNSYLYIFNNTKKKIQIYKMI